MSALCQRWRGRREHYRTGAERLDPSRYGVELIEGDALARAFIQEHHYSGSYPAALCRLGLYRTGPPGSGTQLVGVAVFSTPMNQKVVPARCGVPALHGVELGRFVLLDDVPGNGESWFLARAKRALLQARPQTRAIVSYSDPVARYRADGTQLKPGHIGVIYQATNATYVGRSGARTLLLDRSGQIISPRALAKLRAGDQGRDYAREQLTQLGAPPQHSQEPLREYVDRALVHLRARGYLRQLRHPGNHCYVWRLDGGDVPGISLAYPKQRDSQQLPLVA